MRVAISALVCAVSVWGCSSEVTAPKSSGTGGTTATDGGAGTGTGATTGTGNRGDGGTTTTTPPGTPAPQKPATSSVNASATEPAKGNGSWTIDSIDAQNAGGTQTDRIKVTVIGTTQSGSKSKLLVYFFADNGQMSSVTHWWGCGNTGDPFSCDGIAYCDALPDATTRGEPPCNGLYHNFQERFILFTGSKLKGDFQAGARAPTASQLDGALLLPVY